MKNLNSLIRKVIFGATAAITTTTVNAHSDSEKQFIENIVPKEIIETHHTTDITIPKLILQKPVQLLIDAFSFHRSHRSHSSHRSHASHYSSYTQPREEKPKREEPKKSGVVEEEKANSSSQEMKNTMIFEFGSRVLKRGMQGTDVIELQLILRKKGYKDIALDGHFGEEVEKAVKEFQKKMEIEETGKADVTTIYFLKKD